MRRSRYRYRTWEIGAWTLESMRIGAATYWRAYRLDAEGYTVPGTASPDFGYRRDAVAYIEARA